MYHVYRDDYTTQRDTINNTKKEFKTNATAGTVSAKCVRMYISVFEGSHTVDKYSEIIIRHSIHIASDDDGLQKVFGRVYTRIKHIYCGVCNKSMNYGWKRRSLKWCMVVDHDSDE